MRVTRVKSRFLFELVGKTFFLRLLTGFHGYAELRSPGMLQIDLHWERKPKQVFFQGSRVRIYDRFGVKGTIKIAWFYFMSENTEDHAYYSGYET